MTQSEPPQDNRQSTSKKSPIETISGLIQVVSIVVGVVISVISFNNTRSQEAATRALELRKYNDQRQDELLQQQITAAKPFLDMRQRRYEEAVQQAGILANPDVHTPNELKQAKKRFQELYWADLCLVEDISVDGAMVNLSHRLGLNFNPTEAQREALTLSHSLRDSLMSSWGISEKKTGQIAH